MQQDDDVVWECADQQQQQQQQQEIEQDDDIHVITTTTKKRKREPKQQQQQQKCSLLCYVAHHLFLHAFILNHEIEALMLSLFLSHNNNNNNNEKIPTPQTVDQVVGWFQSLPWFCPTTTTTKKTPTLQKLLVTHARELFKATTTRTTSINHNDIILIDSDDDKSEELGSNIVDNDTSKELPTTNYRGNTRDYCLYDGDNNQYSADLPSLLLCALLRSLGMFARYVVCLSATTKKREQRDFPSSWVDVLCRTTATQTQRTERRTEKATQSKGKKMKITEHFSFIPFRASRRISSSSQELNPPVLHALNVSSINKVEMPVFVSISPLCCKDITPFKLPPAIHSWLLKTLHSLSPGKLFPRISQYMCSLDDETSHVLQRISLEEDMALIRSSQVFASHPLYVTEESLKKFECIDPSCEPLFEWGKKNCLRKVYLRTAVSIACSSERWIEQGRSVKEGSLPVKVVSRRKKVPTKRRRANIVEESPLQLFGNWQTEPYHPKPPENGFLPTNEWGNVIVTRPEMLPPGTTHSKEPGTLAMAKKLGISSGVRPALVGWEYHCGKSHPVIDGVIVCDQYVEALQEALVEERFRKETKQILNAKRKILSNWLHLTKKFLIRERLNQRHKNRTHQHRFGVERQVEDKIWEKECLDCGTVLQYEKI